MRRVFKRDNRQWLISVLLMTLLVRALIPAGYMPATDRPFSFQICPDGFPAQLLQSATDPHAGHHPHHGDDGEAPTHSSANSEHCVFAAAAGAAPLAFALTFSALAINLEAPQAFYVAPAPESWRFRTPQPRGPPALS